MNQRITIKHVAKEVNVTPATVSYVLNGKNNVSQETKEKVLDAIERLGYVPDLSARSLANKDSKLIGIVIPQTEPGSHLMFDNNFYSEIVGSIEYHARKHGYHVIISASDANESYFKLAEQRNLSGIIAIGVYPEIFITDVKKSNIPVVIVDSYVDSHYFHIVRINDRNGGYMATKYLIENGHKDIAIFTGNLKTGGVMDMRYQGYIDAMEEYGLTLKKENIYQRTIDFESGLKIAKKFIDNNSKATAIFCTADILAIGALKCMNENSIKIPNEVSIIGFDDLMLSRYAWPSLTTVHQNIPQKGEKAIELLINSITQPNLSKQECILPIQVVERETVMDIGG